MDNIVRRPDDENPTQVEYDEKFGISAQIHKHALNLGRMSIFILSYIRSKAGQIGKEEKEENQFLLKYTPTKIGR